MKVVFALDLGGTNLRACLVDSEGNILWRKRTETPRASLEVLVDRVGFLLKECNQHNNCEIKAISIAAPAALNAEKGMILKAPNLPYLDGVKICEILEDSFKLPCFLENDANAAAIGEQAFGAAVGKEAFIMITIGTGVGGAIFVRNEIWRGLDGTAGEIGHICVEPLGVPCGCGSRGCLEQYASTSAVVRMTKEMRFKYPESRLHSRLVFSSKEVYEAAVGADELALKVFEKMGFYLGIGLASLINVLNPEAIVIGGGGSNAWDVFISHTREQIQKRAYNEPAERATLLKATLGDDAGVLGAARIAFEELF
ncbi:MAG: ROK family protein [Pyrinomonadaceae bacterium]|nr:ROK family protein [Pyrinomonadaceae bacterium]MCX7639566.1 ROK family protein [Pyrinomonadaceae bacterium]MDW8303959.1 ROK family protein [Acidobacteriota bacterium]